MAIGVECSPGWLALALGTQKGERRFQARTVAQHVEYAQRHKDYQRELGSSQTAKYPNRTSLD